MSICASAQVRAGDQHGTSLNLARIACLILLSFAAAVFAQAAPLHWQLNGVTLSDGGRAFGGFDYDAATGMYSNINVTSTTGSAAGGNFYASVAPYMGSSGPGFVNIVSTTPIFAGSTKTITLTFSSPLTDAGGMVSIVTFAAESTCTITNCASSSLLRTITTGSLSALPASVPKRWFLTGVIFSDGSQLFGGFNYDANLGTFSGISVTTTAGTASPGATYFAKSASSSLSITLVSSSTIVPGTTTVLILDLQSPLTNTGGIVNVAAVTEGTCLSPDCTSSNAVRTAIAPATFTTTQPTDFSKILPQIADGGGFVTVFIITNPTGAPITCRLTFWGNDGNLLKLSLNGDTAASSVNIVVPGHATKFLSTPGSGPNTEGWGIAENVASLGIIAAYRLQLPGVPESEATVEAVNPTAGFAMAFDETPGFDTGFALVNTGANDTVIENLFFYDTNGTLIYSDTSHVLQPRQHESFLFSSRYAAQLAGKRGTVRVYYGVQGNPVAGTIGLTGLGLRVNPGGTFTSLQPVTSSSENSAN